MLVSDYLAVGRENARTARYLCKLLRITPRELSRQIMQERRTGHPICASSSGENPGYYLAANQAEMIFFCGSLKRRINEITKTRQACCDLIEKLPM